MASSSSWLNVAAPIALGGERPVIAADDDNASFATHEMIGHIQMSAEDTARILAQTQSNSFYIFRNDEPPFQSGATHIERIPPRDAVDELAALGGELGYVPPINRVAAVNDAQTPTFQPMHPNQRRGYPDRPVLHETVRRGGQQDRNTL